MTAGPRNDPEPPEPPTAEAPEDHLPSTAIIQGVAERNRAARAMAVLTAVSRGTGFVRVVVVAAVLGTSYLGNTYQSANTIPNILFELFAAGVLQSVLVPIMVDAVDTGDAKGAERTASVVLGAVLSLLAALVAAGAVAGPWIMRLLVSGVDDVAVRNAEVRLGTFLLWFFLPQILFYAANLVATAALNARGSFVLPVFAPTVNNVVVIASYLLFAVLRDGKPPSLDLDTAEKLVLGLGTTLGVVLFCAVPVIGLARSGFRLRARLDLSDPVIGRLARQGGWAAGFLGLTNVLLIVVLWFSNGIEGGVIVYTLAFTIMSLPHSLFAVPVFTTSFPTLTRHANVAHWREFGDEVGRVTRSVMFFALVSTGALVALAAPLAQLMAFGNAADRTTEVAGAIAGFGLGLSGFSMLLTLSRVTYAYADMRTPTLVSVAVVVIGTGVIAVACSLAEPSSRVTMVGVGFSVSQVVGAGLLWVSVRRRLDHEDVTIQAVAAPVARMVTAAAISALAAWLVVRAIDPDTVGSSIVAIVAGGLVLGTGMLGGQWAIGGPAPAVALRSLGADPGRSVVGR